MAMRVVTRHGLSWLKKVTAGLSSLFSAQPEALQNPCCLRKDQGPLRDMAWRPSLLANTERRVARDIGNADGEPEVLNLRLPTIEFCVYESACSIFWWDVDKGQFQRTQISD
jgi:hypothetical protein